MRDVVVGRDCSRERYLAVADQPEVEGLIHCVSSCRSFNPATAARSLRPVEIWGIKLLTAVASHRMCGSGGGPNFQIAMV